MRRSNILIVSRKDHKEHKGLANDAFFAVRHISSPERAFLYANDEVEPLDEREEPSVSANFRSNENRWKDVRAS